MWRKDKLDSEPQPAAPYIPPAPVAKSTPSERSLMGPSITMKGEISGNEDLLVEGTFEGTVNLKKNVVTIGQNGRVTANVCGRVIHIEGEVTGDCIGTEQVILHKAGTVRGNICAPRVTVEDGARLQGTIDTGTQPEEDSDTPRSETRYEKTTSIAADEPQPMV